MTKTDSDYFWIILYGWILTIFGAVFAGHEVAIMKHKIDRDVANAKLQACNRIITGVTK